LARSEPSVLSHSAATLSGTVVAALMSVTYVSLGARWLGPSAYGVVGAAISTANLFFLVLNPLEAGITLRVAQLTGRGALDELHAYATRVTRGLALLGAAGLLCWSAFVLLYARAAATHASGAALWLGVFCCAAFVGCGPRAVLRGRELFVALALNVVFESALRLSAGLGLLWLLGLPSAMLAGYALGMFGAIASACLRMSRGLPASTPPARPPGLLAQAALPLRSLSAPLLGLNLYTVLASNADVLAASRYLEPHDAGLYAGAASLARMVPMAANPLLLVLFSRLATESAARKDTRRTLRLGTLWIVTPLGLSLLVPAFGGELVLNLVLGEAYSRANELLIYQWATACTLTAQVFFAESLLATSRIRAGWLFLLPSSVLVLALLSWHESALQIARTSLIACACAGSVACLAMWRSRAEDAPR
jgi:O-antigen/teichoic acid export membrane protein